MQILRYSLLALIASFLTASSLSAGILNVVNNSFEQATGYNGGAPGTVPGWTAPPNEGTYGQTSNVTSLFTAGLSGNNAIYFGGRLSQQIAATFQTGQSYTFSIDLGNPSNVGDDGAGFSMGFRNTANNGFVSSQFVGSYNVQAVPDGTFQNFSFTYTATAADNGNPVILGFDDFYYGGSNDLNGNGGFSSYYVDNVVLSTTAVPEPSTYVGGFIGLSVCGLAFARQLARRRA